MALTINTEPTSLDNSSSWELESTNYARPNFRVKAELIIAGIKKAVKWQSKSLPSELFLAYNGTDGAGVDYRIGIAYASESYDFVKSEDNPIISPVGGTWEHDNVKDPYLLRVADTYYIYYTGFSAANTNQIGVATSPDGITWTKYGANPVVTFADVANIHRFPVVYYDENEFVVAKKWKMWYTDENWDIGYAYSPDGYVWTKFAGGNPVLTRGAGGTWDDANLIPGTIYYDNGTWYFYYGGKDGAVWYTGLATFTDPEGVYTKNADNPILSGKETSTASLTDDLLTGNKIVTIADTTLFEVNEYIWFRDDNTTSPELNRVVSINSATQLTLYDDAVADFTVAQNALIRSAYNKSVSPRGIWYENGYCLGLSIYQVWNDLGVSVREQSALARSDSLDSGWVFDYDEGLLLPPTEAGDWDLYSYENPSVIIGSVIEFDFKKILYSLITYDTIDFDSLNIQTPNSSSYKSYIINFTEYWEDTDNVLVTGANTTSDTKYIFEVDVPVADFADYNLSADDELFLTDMPVTKKKIKIGDNLVTGWTNVAPVNGFDIFTAPARYITSAIDSSAVNYGICYSNNIGHIKEGEMVIFYCDFTKVSGTFPYIVLIEGTTISWKSNGEIFAEGYNYIELTAIEDIAVCRICIYSTEANQVSFTTSLVYVSKGYNELDYLAFITEETSLWINYTQYDIDGTSLGATHLDAVTILGYRGVCPISALLFTHSTTQVESISVKVRTETPADRSLDVKFIRDSVCYRFPVRIEWLNKFGAFDAYTFLADYNESRKTQRQYYKDTDDTEQVLDIESYQEIEAFSTYEIKTMLDWIKTIQDSKKVYWVVDNERIEVTVVSSEQQIKNAMARSRISLIFRRII